MTCPKCDSVKLVSLPYNSEVYICPDCYTRHIYNHRDTSWSRDFMGEEQWKKMASYESVNQTYEEVFRKEYEFATRRLARAS